MPAQGPIAARYERYASVVMGNHVHVLLTPKVALKVVTQGLKGSMAHPIHGLDNQRRPAVWQDESYDHWACDEDEPIRIIP